MVDSEEWDALQMVNQRPRGEVVAVYKRQEKSSAGV